MSGLTPPPSYPKVLDEVGVVPEGAVILPPGEENAAFLEQVSNREAVDSCHPVAFATGALLMLPTGVVRAVPEPSHGQVVYQPNLIDCAGVVTVSLCRQRSWTS